MDTVLFSLTILCGLFDGQGRVWRCHPNQFYAIEVTLPNMDLSSLEDKASVRESRTLAFLELLPTISCISPSQTLNYLASNQTGKLILYASNVFVCLYQPTVYLYTI